MGMQQPVHTLGCVVGDRVRVVDCVGHRHAGTATCTREGRAGHKDDQRWSQRPWSGCPCAVGGSRRIHALVPIVGERVLVVI
jgi:hypothetical protein